MAGLSLARSLERQGVHYRLLEARPRFGGRIETYRAASGAAYDLGPAWFWPGQPRIAALISDLGLEVFAQQAEGAGRYEDARGRVQEGQGFASMAGAYRLVGGLSELTSRLAEGLSGEGLTLDARVTALRRAGGRITVDYLERGKANQIEAGQVVLALPPRLVAEGIALSPALPAEACEALRNLPTWMAGQAKLLLLYDRPFWRQAGLSGDAMSQVGPLGEIHDASPADGGPSALFGFVGLPAAARRDPDALVAQAVAQVGRIFGPEALTPRDAILRDWARDADTAMPLDQVPLTAHPTYGLPVALRNQWDGRLLFGSTEVAPQFGGYLEGALEASDAALASLTAVRPLPDRRTADR
ncbi:MAG: FAD-dependent oxidoreductase [Rhodospirillales bacterium]